MKAITTAVLAVGVVLTAAAQTIDKRVPAGTGQQASLFAGRLNTEVEKRTKESQGLIVTQAEKIRVLEARVKELEAELASLKAAASPVKPEAAHN